MICKHCKMTIAKITATLWGRNAARGSSIGDPLLCSVNGANVHEPAEPAATPQKKRLMRKPYDHGEPPHEECPDCRGVCSPVEPTAPADSTPQKKYVFDNFCEGCANPMDCSIKGRCLIPEANSTRPEPLRSTPESRDKVFAALQTMVLIMATQELLERFWASHSARFWNELSDGQKAHSKRCAELFRSEILKRTLSAAPRTQGSELECKHCGQTIRPAKDSKVRGYWIGTNNYLTCPNNVGQPHEPLAAQPQPAPRPAEILQQIINFTYNIGPEDYLTTIYAIRFKAQEFFTAIPAALPLAQAADEVLAELSLLNGKFTQKQNALFDKVRELAAIPAQKEEK